MGRREVEVEPRHVILVYAAILIPVVATPFGTVLTLAFAAIAAMVGMRMRGEPVFASFRPEQASAALLAFAAFGAISAAWSPGVTETLFKSALLAIVTLAGLMAVRSGCRSSPAVAVAASQALLLVYAILAVHAMFEILTDQVILKTYYNVYQAARAADLKHLRFDERGVFDVSEIFINRSVYVVTLFSVPAWIGTAVIGSVRLRLAARVFVAGTLIVLLTDSQHESSKLAIACGAIVLATSWFTLRGAALLAIIGWLAAAMLVVPVALMLGSAKLDEAGWLPASARDRVKIWRYTAQKTLHRPLLGHGAASTPVHYDLEFAKAIDALALPPEAKREQMQQYRRARLMSDRLGPHAHNVYLQVWFELGLAGALLLATAGVIFLRRIGEFADRNLTRAGLTQFSVVAASAGTSYSLWQPWFLSGIALSAIFIAIAARASASARGADGERNDPAVDRPSASVLENHPGA